MVEMVGLGMPDLDGEAPTLGWLYVTSRDPLGVTSGALVLWGSAGRSNDTSILSLVIGLGICDKSSGFLLDVFCWGSGV